MDNGASAGSEKNDNTNFSRIWQRTFDDPVAFYTLWLTAFTGVLCVATIGLYHAARGQSHDIKSSINIAENSAKAAEKSADIAERALVSTERAFLYFENPSYDRIVNDQNQVVGWYFVFSCKNSGATPALEAEIRANCVQMDGECPRWWPFPDTVGPMQAQFFVAPGAVRRSVVLQVQVGG
jgi:hypothetical protein